MPCREIDVSLRFRMRDAVSTGQGYLLPGGAFELIDIRSEHRKAQYGELPPAVSVALRRSRTRSIDF
ncbi:hypothetical protein C8D87_11475 [Lentzea atacamensis]|uniref:Uncharacterized protein n=1 Tax=Lentzea atacamensis TaxID=531938 RepID=A0ABX9DY36_9PSEU|nr:hypothetical protein C8D87_11475 [Lentzea atacamensis]